MNETPDALYRITAQPEATEADFQSQALLYIGALLQQTTPERPMPEDGETLHMWAGVSAFSDRRIAEGIMRRYRRTGSSIARLQVPQDLIDDGTIRIERTGRRPAHWTLWGPPRALLACVQSG